MSADFINYTFGKLIEDLKKIVQAGVGGIVNEIIENKLKEIEDIRSRLSEIEKILKKDREERIDKNEPISSDEKSAVNNVISKKKKCIYEGCERDAFARGYCKNHYYQLKRKGLLKNIERKIEDKKCAFEGCEKIPVARGLCKNHYYQYKRGSIEFRDGKYIKKNP